MKNRTVISLLYSDTVDMGCIPVRQPFPTQQVDQIDPLLRLHHLNIDVPETMKPQHAGVGAHPHKGFSQLAFVLRGGLHHRDSRGNDSNVFADGAQWMNAGMGIVHSERPPHDINKKGGRQEIIQLWINTPAKHKLEQPEHYPVNKKAIHHYPTDDRLASIKVIAGELFGLTGPVPGKTPVIVRVI